jgi:hypothetical protein
MTACTMDGGDVLLRQVRARGNVFQELRRLRQRLRRRAYYLKPPVFSPGCFIGSQGKRPSRTG